MNQPPVEIKVLNIDHLGIIAGIIDEMQLVELVNKQIGIQQKELLTPNSPDRFSVGQALREPYSRSFW
ncbi:DUF4277 domain-containing protein [Microcoleus sp.]|uniref:DUF4277 domain-containing protein n=1 Tax=Microcoleus sp. TaxID=44472 RepID=UPI00403E4C58